jgi:cytoskeleton protein RodZ
VRGVTFFQRIRTPFAEAAAEDLPRPRRLVGELLQERREDLGLDLDEIAAALKIKPIYLVALEQSRAHDLPGATYAIGFVRAYAEFLGLDPEQLLARFKSESSGIAVRPDLTLPVPLGERSLPGGALVLVALILALCGYGTWYYLSTGERDRPARVAAVPIALQTPSAAPILVSPSPGAVPGGDPPAAAPATPLSPSLIGAAASTTSPPATAQSPPPNPALPPPGGNAGTPSAPVPSSPPAVAKPLPPAVPATASPPAVAANTPPPAAAKPAAEAAGGQIVIRATTDCWIRIQAPDQTIVFSRVLKSGEIYKVPQRPGLSLRTGNAGVLEITVDGKPVPSIGAIGMLRRDVVLDPAALSAGTAVHG